MLDTSALAATGAIVRTDTYYPGWSGRNGTSKIEIEKLGLCFSTIPASRNPANGTIELNYTPRSMAIAYPLVATGMLLCGSFLLAGFVPRRSGLMVRS